MRYALVSDIHGNEEALRAVFARLAPDDALLCMGDSVGYGPDPNACLALLRDRVHAAVLGNHDVAAVDGEGFEHFNPAARLAIEWTRGVLAPDLAAWLDGLAYEVRMPDYLMVHGAPVTYFRYIEDNADAAEAFAATDARLVFIGHTHIAEYYALGPSGEIAHGHRQNGGDLALDPLTRYIVNPGSVGQPRDLNPDASFAFYDDAAQTIVWQRAAYAIPDVQAKIGAARLPEVCARRLAVGR